MPTLLVKVKYPALLVMMLLCAVGEDYKLNFKDYSHKISL